MQCFGLDWIGLDWIGLDWIGLDWIGLDCRLQDIEYRIQRSNSRSMVRTEQEKRRQQIKNKDGHAIFQYSFMVHSLHSIQALYNY